MIIKCSRCGKQKIVDIPLYSSPVIKCDACGDYFYEGKAKEAALYPPPINEKERQSLSVYIGGVLGAIFLLFGVIGAIAEADASYLGVTIFGLLMFGTSFLLIWSANKEYRKREKTYQKALAESKERLRSKKYQNLLIESSNQNKNVIKLLEQYNKRNNLILGDEDPLIVEEARALPAKQSQATENNTVAHLPIDNIFCRKCGVKLFDDSIFCHRCGEKTRNH